MAEQKRGESEVTPEELTQLRRYAWFRAYTLQTPLYTQDDLAQEAVLHVLQTQPAPKFRAVAAVRRMQALRRSELEKLFGARGYKALRAALQAKQKLSHRLGREPRNAEIIREAGLTWSEFAASAVPELDSSAEPIGGPDPAAAYEENRTKQALRTAVHELPKRQRVAAEDALYRGAEDGGRHSIDLKRAVQALRQRFHHETQAQ